MIPKGFNVQGRRTKVNELSGEIAGLRIEIHRELGPGLLESACLYASVPRWLK